jgi:hypothetical protein
VANITPNAARIGLNKSTLLIFMTSSEWVAKTKWRLF